MSRMLFTPAETTATSVVESSVRSALTSKDCCAPRCTPPRPPVTKTRIPASAASRIVEATVVAPWPPRATTYGRSRMLTLSTSPLLASSSRSSSPRPIRGRPCSTAIVAGTTPASRMMPSTSRAISTLRGYGMPWLMIVLSSATTGAPSRSASATSSVSCSEGCGVMSSLRPAPARAGRGSGPAGRCARWRWSPRRPRGRAGPRRAAYGPVSTPWHQAASIASPAPVTSATRVGSAGRWVAPSGPLSSEPRSPSRTQTQVTPRSCRWAQASTTWRSYVAGRPVSAASSR